MTGLPLRHEEKEGVADQQEGNDNDRDRPLVIWHETCLSSDGTVPPCRIQGFAYNNI